MQVLHSCAAGEGFDTRVSRESGMLGQGSYFAWAASYSLEGYARRVRLVCPDVRVIQRTGHRKA